MKINNNLKIQNTMNNRTQTQGHSLPIDNIRRVKRTRIESKMKAVSAFIVSTNPETNTEMFKLRR